MVAIRKMRVGVAQRRVAMAMGVQYICGERLGMVVRMVQVVVAMGVLVFHVLVQMLVTVLLAEMQPDACGHQ